MDLRVARRYAAALFKAAQDTGSVKETAEDLEAIIQVMAANSDAKAFLESPEVDRADKQRFVDRVFSDRARPLTMRLLRLLIDKNRQRELPGIHREYTAAMENADGILRAFVTSAVPLTDEQIRRVTDRIAEQTGKRILAEVEVDPAVLGGVSVQYGNSVLDGTVAGALKRLEEKFQIDVLKQA